MVSDPIHLFRRFVGSLSPRPLSAVDDRWAREQLSSGEIALWVRMPVADRKHAAGVAREVDRRLGGADRAVLAAALLHDVGKVDSGLGTFGRILATFAGLVADRARHEDWAGSGGITGRVGRYLRHDVIGARMLAEAGAAPETVTWAREHHLPPERWTLPADVAGALAAADDD